MVNTTGVQQWNAGVQPSQFNFAEWDSFVTTSSFNKAAKVYIGVPAGFSAATSGYVDADTLGTTAQRLQQTYSTFGGIMLWYAMLRLG
jgi:chitinase